MAGRVDAVPVYDYAYAEGQRAAGGGNGPRRLLVVQGSQVFEWPNLSGPNPVTHRAGEIRMDMQNMRPVRTTQRPQQERWPVSRCINQSVPVEVYKNFSRAKKRRLKEKRRMVEALRNSAKMRNLEERRDKLLAAVKKGKLELEYLSIQLYGMEAGEYPATFGPMVRLKKQKLRDKLDRLKQLFEQFKEELAEFRKEKNMFRNDHKRKKQRK
ncbi:uncharacterized protein LOC132198731 [Neocloeon triangulifer]|uniref:uncharacterized protein LOC132198731 n=1 Tax=Neocloeon triangulifer TaxID=2078957 RepID=UPI00286F08B2|nr:uncharacterized protein LOC132198731 [Neocloeon triangulifer]